MARGALEGSGGGLQRKLEVTVEERRADFNFIREILGVVVTPKTGKF